MAGTSNKETKHDEKGANGRLLKEGTAQSRIAVCGSRFGQNLKCKNETSQTKR